MPQSALKWLALAMMISTAMLLTTPMAAANYGFGSYVDTGHVDHVPTAEAIDEVRLCLIDEDGSDHWNNREPLVLRFSEECDRVGYDDRCIICLDDKEPGSEITTEDPAHGRFLIEIADYNLTYVDMAGEGGIDEANPTYIDLRNPQRERVDPGDLRLTAWHGYEALTTVEAGDQDIGASMDHITGDPLEFGDEGALMEGGDGFYLNTDGGSPGDELEHVPSDAIRLDTGVTNPTAAMIEEALADLGPQEGEPHLAVIAVDLLPEDPQPGGLLHIHITVEKQGSGPGDGTIETLLNGVLADARATPTLEPDDEAKLASTLPIPTDADQLHVSVGELVKNVTVSSTGSGEETTEEHEALGAQQADAATERQDKLDRAAVPSVPAGILLAAIAIAAARAD